MGRAEAAAFGTADRHDHGRDGVDAPGRTPFVFNEDIAWSICLTVGSIFALLGVLERRPGPG